MNYNSTIIYTKTDEAPALATRAFLPLIRPFIEKAGIEIQLADISLAGRILAAFSDRLPENQQVPDALAELGELVKKPQANIIKLPNISASVTQIIAAVKELQKKGYDIPDYPEEPKSETERETRARFDQVKGSAVNPVIRMGNSDRRVPAPVKKHARKHPHSMGEWSSDSKSHVSSMQRGDFYGSEKSTTISEPTSARIELEKEDGSVELLKERIDLEKGEVLDSAVMNARELRSFLEHQMEDAQKKDVLFSIHLKATMMKISDPIIFGQAVSVFFKEVFEKYRKTFEELGVTPDTGVGGLLSKLSELPAEKRREIEEEIEATYERRPELAMVNSDRGITNLHVPSDVIIDASMPAAIRSGGKMWSPHNSLKDMKAVIPDRSYAGIYQETIDFCKKHGAFDPSSMGSVSNVGLMAQKAEEYGSHDKTFRIPEAGRVRLFDSSGKVLLEQEVEGGDIFRACQVKDEPIRDWVRLAVERAQSTGTPAIFWLDENRAHDAELIKKVNSYLPEHDTEGLDIRIMSPVEAMRFSLERARDGLDTISVTGNVLRDYLTDLFPILEVGTSAKMLSIVPLMAGGGLFETGAGGSAPKHVQQFLEEGHLRWDSLGEYLALAVSLEHEGKKRGNEEASRLAETLNRAIGRFLEDNRSPSRKTGEPDNRSSHYYLAMYWAEELGDTFSDFAGKLRENEETIIAEMIAAQGEPYDIGGYYFPDERKADASMLRASETLYSILKEFCGSDLL